jgi:hypothetical protein
MPIKVCDYRTEREVGTEAEVEAILAERTANGMNMWWVAFDTQFPCVSILANKSLACVHFHPHDEHPGFQAQGPASGLDPNGETMFSISGPNEEVWMPNTSVVEFSVAIRAVRDFLRDQQMSSSIRWLEL